MKDTKNEYKNRLDKWSVFWLSENYSFNMYYVIGLDK